jgi:hypothetical protein
LSRNVELKRTKLGMDAPNDEEIQTYYRNEVDPPMGKGQ